MKCLLLENEGKYEEQSVLYYLDKKGDEEYCLESAGVEVSC
jgi:hypothetical protein